MTGKYRLKAQTVQAIDVESPITQAADIASMIGASAFIVDILANAATFTAMDGAAQIAVSAGKVVSISSGTISVQDRAEFYELFEPDGSGQ